MIIESLLDTDLYKLTMQQAVHHHFARATAEYTFACRTPDVDLRPFADEIRDEVQAMGTLTLTDDETAYLKSIRYLSDDYVDALCRFCVNPNAVELRTDDGALRLTVRGNWFETILWEVPLLAIVNEVYFRRTNPATDAILDEGRRRLHAKCQRLRDAGLETFGLIEFGTRRRYGRTWQAEVVETLQREIPQFLLGTSNVHLARTLGLKPFGTMAHEWLQAGQALTALADSQRFMLETWMQEFRGDLGIALSDVVGLDAFLRDFDRLFSKAYDGARHDSGDPFAWGERLISHYQSFGIDPRAKAAVFSDGLDIPKALALARHFSNRIQTSFGIGTNLTNDLGFPALNIVLKMTRCNGRPVAKLSDTPGKAMSVDPVFLAYLRQTFG